LNWFPLERPLLDLLPDLLNGSEVHFIETIQLEPPACATPPLCIHLLDSTKCAFAERFGVGYSATLGRRATMEDCVVLHVSSDRALLISVFDGHGGSATSAVAANGFQEEVRLGIVKSVAADLDVWQALARCFTAVNSQVGSSMSRTDAPRRSRLCTRTLLMRQASRMRA
jgi:hypothetical protein